jgi:AcrR family transcriptional regulator
MRGLTVSGARPDRAERREYFLDVTAGLIESEGLAAVTMELVAALAEVSKPVLYSHFADRGALLTALLERCWRDLDRTVQARLRTARSFDDCLEAVVTGYFEEIARQGRVLQLMVTSGWHEPAVEAARQRRHRAAEREWSAFYQERIGLRAPVADAAAAILRSAVQGAAAHWIEHPNSTAAGSAQTCLMIMRAGLDRLRRQDRLDRERAEPPAGAARRPRARSR